MAFKSGDLSRIDRRPVPEIITSGSSCSGGSYRNSNKPPRETDSVSTSSETYVPNI
jgi:hypothetical protein